jgi:hypothetical protein
VQAPGGPLVLLNMSKREQRQRTGRERPYLWVPDIGVTSCDLRVLMDQPTEAISSHDPRRRRQDNWHAGSEWRRLPQGAVRAVQVVVVGVLGQHRPQLPAAQDQHPVQHLPPNRAHPPLR